MAIFYFDGYSKKQKTLNFGDDINPHLLSYFFSKKLLADPHHVLIGIGSILNDDYFQQVQHYQQRIVFSSGAGYGTVSAPPRTGWHFACVRGPKTANLLGLDPHAAICDGAILLTEMWRDLHYQPVRPIGFVPHVVNHLDAGNSLQSLAQQLDFEYISPSLDPRDFVRAICSVECVITESLHGAIVADAFRVPWAAVDLLGVNSFKWEDWCESVNLSYRPFSLSFRIWDPPKNEIPAPSQIRLAGRWLKRRLLVHQLNKIQKKMEPMLSAPGLIARRVDRLLAKVDWINETFG